MAKKTKDKKDHKNNKQQAPTEVKQEQQEELKSEKAEKEKNEDTKPKDTAESEDVKPDQKAEEKEKSDQEKIEELNDKYLRLAAEYDNYRRRTLKEKMELSKNAGEDILINILPVMDDFERGLSTIERAKEIDAVKEGVKLIYTKFKEFLKQRGVKEIDAKEKEFDTDLHEAITKIPAPDEKLKGKVVDVVEKGYLLNDKVIRHSKVVIGE
ncbi:MAG: nucleotide exchange factor GrpE [Bacteroidales bacterium]